MGATEAPARGLGAPADLFADRHIGPSAEETRRMLEALGLKSLSALSDAAIPASIRAKRPLSLPPPLSEREALERLRALAAENAPFRSFIGMGYHESVTPAVIQRGVLENPGWYTAYTPYQAEISQGRLEALLVFQTMVMELTGFEVANASLLDEATAAAEAMAMGHAAHAGGSDLFFVSKDCHPQTIAVVRTRAEALGWTVEVGDHDSFDLSRRPFGLLLQYPKTGGGACDYGPLARRAKAAGAMTVVAADILSLALLRPPAEFGADAAVGSTQRFGVPPGFGGPHAAFLATREAYRRLLPGRVVGVSKDADGAPALRLALQTREQHIRREKATSNICTAQVLPAALAAFYAVYHGPEGLRRIAERVHALAASFAEGLRRLGLRTAPEPFFDTVTVLLGREEARRAVSEARAKGMNLRELEGGVAAAFDEAAGPSDVEALWGVFSAGRRPEGAVAGELPEGRLALPEALTRRGPFLRQEVFNAHRSETQMMRYLKRLESRDLSLTSSMIPLGSCTMKLNAAAEMLPITWPGFSRLHPYAPAVQAPGYFKLFADLEAWLCAVTGFSAVSLQPNAGSQGEYAGLLAIRRYHESRGEGRRKVCLVPLSAHGTNPASAAMAGMTIVPVATVPGGDIDLSDLKAKAAAHAGDLAALMVTYPSTHGVFEEDIREVCDAVHARGGQVYMDGANMNALVGLCRPAEIGADVCHLNLHKTFCIPHGGGGPGMGPIAVARHLAPFLPRSPLSEGGSGSGAVAAAPFSSASILPIPWAYIAMMGAEGLRRATETAILSANYVAKRLSPHYPVLFRGRSGFVAHECILDFRPFKESAGVLVEDAAKRLMDYGFHAPTVSFPVAGTMMIEPTESEDLPELDRFCEAMISIRAEIREIEEGKAAREDNLLKGAPHTARAACADSWTRPYPRERAVFPLPWVRARKFWPSVARVDGVYGDRNFSCSCSAIPGFGE